jgi:phage gp29-like protein
MGEIIDSLFGTRPRLGDFAREMEDREERMETISAKHPILQSQFAKIEAELIAEYMRGLVTNDDAIDDVKKQGIGFYHQMLRTDTHLAGLDRKLRSNAANVGYQVLPSDAKDQTAVEIADFVWNVLDSFDFIGGLAEVLHAASKGFSVCEVIYNKGFVWKDSQGKRWKKVGISRINRVKETQFSILSDRRVGLLNLNDQTYGTPIPENTGKYIVAFYGSGPWGDGMLNYVYPAYVMKRASMVAFSKFQERWGNPPVVGYYSGTPGSGIGDTLLEMLEKFYAEMIAALPEGARLETLQPGTSYDYIPGFNYMDDQMSRFYTGGDLSTGHAGGRGNLGATEVHAQSEDELQLSLARSARFWIEEQLIKPLVILNFGHQDAYPYMALGSADTDTPEAFMQRVQIMFDKHIPVPISKSQFYEKSGFAPPSGEGDSITPLAMTAENAGPTVNFQEGSETLRNSPNRTITKASATRLTNSAQQRLSGFQSYTRRTLKS